jgi:hypothetical protein
LTILIPFVIIRTTISSEKSGESIEGLVRVYS